MKKIFKNSYVINKNIFKVNKEYSISSKQKKENKKVRWSSMTSMINRFKLFFKLIKNKKLNNWLDIGSGTGRFFLIADKLNFNTNFRAGIEVNKNLIRYSKKNKYKYKTIFKNSDLIKTKDTKKYELVTMIGVLQNCGYQPYFFLKQTIKRVQNGGIFFLTSRNINWGKLNKESFNNNEPHSWFDINDVEISLKKLKMTIVRKGGFLANKNRIVKINSSNSFFILAKKRK